jgi:hypothetical protein
MTRDEKGPSDTPENGSTYWLITINFREPENYFQGNTVEGVFSGRLVVQAFTALPESTMDRKSGAFAKRRQNM